MPTAVNPCSSQFRLDLGGRARQSRGDQSQRPIQRRRRDIAEGVLIRLVNLAQICRTRSRVMPKRVADLGERVLAAVLPAVVADQNVPVPFARRRGEDLDEFLLDRHPDTFIHDAPRFRLVDDSEPHYSRSHSDGPETDCQLSH